MQLSGHKAFSYFSVVCKNYFIQKTKTAKKKAKSDVHFDKEILKDLEKNCLAIMVPSCDVLMEYQEFYTLLKQEAKGWRKKFLKDQERTVLEAIILLLNSPDLIEICNKKGVYLYLREITRFVY